MHTTNSVYTITTHMHNTNFVYSITDSRIPDNQIIPLQKLGLLRCTDDPLLGADLHRPYRFEHPLLAADLHRPYRLEQWADGISDGSHGHNNGLDCPLVHLVGAFATVS